MPIKPMDLDDIELNTDYHFREKTDPAVVEEYSLAMQRGEDLFTKDPMIVANIDGHDVLLNGWTRYPACKLAGRRVVPVDYRAKLTSKEGRMLAATSNVRHGQRPTARDIGRWVPRLQADGYPDDVIAASLLLDRGQVIPRLKFTANEAAEIAMRAGAERRELDARVKHMVESPEPGDEESRPKKRERALAKATSLELVTDSEGVEYVGVRNPITREFLGVAPATDPRIQHQEEPTMVRSQVDHVPSALTPPWSIRPIRDAIASIRSGRGKPPESVRWLLLELREAISIALAE